MAPDINALARAERDKALTALDAAKKAIDGRWSTMTSDQKLEALKQISDITSQQNAISTAFVHNIFNSKAHQNVLAQISTATKAMNDEAGKINDAASTLSSAAKIVGYAIQVAGFFALLA